MRKSQCTEGEMPLPHWREEKFFDIVDNLQLIDKSMEVEYPLAIPILGLQLHMSPRGLKFCNHCPGLVLPRNDIIPGCSQSTTFARILLYNMLTFLWDDTKPARRVALAIVLKGRTLHRYRPSWMI